MSGSGYAIGLAPAIVVSLLKPAAAESNLIKMDGVSFRTSGGFDVAAVLIVAILVFLYATWW